MFDSLRAKGFDVEFQSHARAILSYEYQAAIAELEEILLAISIPIGELVGSGGGETKTTQRLRRAFSKKGWIKTNFEIRKEINGRAQSSISHEVDHVRTFDGTAIALEIEWNNKDPFFDRDLENFKRLHVEGAISIGVVITRGTTFQAAIKDRVMRYAQREGLRSIDDLRDHRLTRTERQRRELERALKLAEKTGKSFAEVWAGNLCNDKFGESTTHWKKLQDRLSRHVGHPCPLLLIGIPIEVVTD